MSKGIRQVPGGAQVDYLYDEGHLFLAPQVNPTHQFFSHVEYDTGRQRHFDVGKLQRMIDAKAFRYKIIKASVTARDAEFLLQHNGIELPHLERINSRMLMIPGIMVFLEDGTQIIVDGSHRYVKRWQLGIDFMEFYKVREWQAKPCLLAMPDDHGLKLTETQLTAVGLTKARL